MIFFSLVVMPALRHGLPPPQRQELIRALGRRYRVLGWTSIGVLLATGPLLAWRHGVVWSSGFGQLLSLKLVLVGIMLALTVLHDLSMGPRGAQLNVPLTDGQRLAIVWLARVNLLVVLGILVCGAWLTEW
jgi:putative copper export protein